MALAKSEAERSDEDPVQDGMRPWRSRSAPFAVGHRDRTALLVDVQTYERTVFIGPASRMRLCAVCLPAASLRSLAVES